MIAKPKKLGIFLAGLALLFIVAAVFFREPNAREISYALNATMIDQFSLKEATRDEAMSLVMERFHRQHPEMKGIRLEFYPNAEAMRAELNKSMPGMGDARATVSLRNIPAFEALKYVTSLSGVGFAVRSGRIYLYAPSNPPPITMRERLTTFLDSFFARFRSSSP